MADAKFTPGPWKFDGEYVWADAIQGYVANPATEDMLSGDSVPHREKHAVIEANGRLIAAAPEMLDALRLIADGFARGAIKSKLMLANVDDEACDTMPMTPGDVVRAAIAKATGEAA